jgi:Ni,Fe-hydrogenase I small subunit
MEMKYLNEKQRPFILYKSTKHIAKSRRNKYNMKIQDKICSEMN